MTSSSPTFSLISSPSLSSTLPSSSSTINIITEIKSKVIHHIYSHKCYYRFYKFNSKIKNNDLLSHICSNNGNYTIKVASSSNDSSRNITPRTSSEVDRRNISSQSGEIDQINLNLENHVNSNSEDGLGKEKEIVRNDINNSSNNSFITNNDYEKKEEEEKKKELEDKNKLDDNSLTNSDNNNNINNDDTDIDDNINNVNNINDVNNANNINNINNVNNVNNINSVSKDKLSQN